MNGRCNNPPTLVKSMKFITTSMWVDIVVSMLILLFSHTKLSVYKIFISWYGLIAWIPWNLSFRYINCNGQFTPKMKANAEPWVTPCTLLQTCALAAPLITTHGGRQVSCAATWCIISAPQKWVVSGLSQTLGIWSYKWSSFFTTVV